MTIIIEIDFAFSQCIPPPAETCEEVIPFCSLDQMNGYSCTTSSSTLSTCRTGCSPGGNPDRRDWLAFVSTGGNATITLNVGNCPVKNLPGFGICPGFWGDCHCMEYILCIPGYIQEGNSMQYNLLNLKPCKIYYIVLDHGDDQCDFTINTSGGSPPTLSPIGNINNISSGIIQPVCQGICDYKFFVNPPSGSCLDVTYVWTLDGVEVGGDKNEILLDFPDQGDFTLCVTAYLGNPKAGSVCAQEGPKCATVKVRPLADRTGIPRTLCYEEVDSRSFKWHSQFINSSGVYRETFTQANCCKYDSVVEFNVLAEIPPTEVFYFSCDNQPYVDPLGFSYPICSDKILVSLPNSTERYKCDSTIRLTSIGITLVPNWSAQCAGDMVEMSPNINMMDTCSKRTVLKLDYNWYKKSDTTKTSIGKSERLTVDTINSDYCLDINVMAVLGFDTAYCTKTICETINESEAGGIVQNTIISYCDSAVINGQTYKQTDTITQNFMTASGCDSIVNTIIDIHQSTNTGIRLTGCDSVNINGSIYKLSGDYTQLLISSYGCDSVLTIHATINNSKKSSVYLTQCDSIVVNGQVYTQSGNYLQQLQTVSGCDSILQLDLDIPVSNNQNFNHTGCDSLEINGKIYYQSGNYIEKLSTTQGCDSIINLKVDISNSRITEYSFNECDSVSFNGKVYKTTGDYNEVYTSTNGCDSIIVIHVNIPNSNTFPLVLTTCDSVTINQTHYIQSGHYTQKLISHNGCDSILNIDLTIESNSQANISQSACDSVLINNIIYKQSGSYQQKIQTTAGCDSIINLDLNILKSSRGDTLFRSCDSVTINNITYHQTGIYTQTLINTEQCDSTLLIDFTRLSKSATSLTYESCDSVIVNNKIYKQTGNYTQILSNVNQCDSVLNLQIKILSGNQLDLNQSGCDSLIINGSKYTQSGNYTQNLSASNGCDSTLNLHLEISNSSTGNVSVQTCDSANVNSIIYKASGSYQQLLNNASGCDSLLHLQIDVKKSTMANFSQTACDSVIINNKLYKLTGVYQQLLTNVNGCDSMLTLDLTIKPGNPTTLDAGPDTTICHGEIAKLNAQFKGSAKVSWLSPNGSFDNPGQLTTNYYPSITGNHRIYLNAKDDCKQWLDSLEVIVLPKQIIQITGDTIIDPCVNEINFKASGAINYIWNPASFIDCLDPPCSLVKLKSHVANRFTITSQGPCVVPAELNLSLLRVQTDLYLPNAFSPNGDNINDIFLPIFNCEQVTYYSMQIFDRWGNLLFESTNKDLGWNGKQEEMQMIPGVYPYVIQYELHNSERKVKVGDVTLIR